MLTGRKNQCQGCKEFFTANSSFSKHRTGEYGGGRRCMTEAEMLEKKMAKDKDGFWMTRAFNPSELNKFLKDVNDEDEHADESASTL